MTGKSTPILRTIAVLCAALALSTCAGAPGAQAPREAMVVAADPRAAEAGLQMLREGGNATDAAIATMAVLGLVEPQSAGVGGGGFLLHYDGASRAVVAYDGREMAPAGATSDMFMGTNGQPLQFLDAVASGRSIGTPSLFAMLAQAHREHGRLAWARLFEPAIELAEHGFAVSPRLAATLRFVGSGPLRNDPEARAYFYLPSGDTLPQGFVRTNPAYANALRALAANGPDALTRGPIADAIVAAAHRGPRPGTLTLADLQNYRPRRLEALCGNFRLYRVCGMPPPSSGGEATLAILGLYERAHPAPGSIDDAMAWSAFLWASRLAYADRNFYLADDTQQPVPFRNLVAPAYLDQRAELIDLETAAPALVEPGDPSTVMGGRSLLQTWGREIARSTPGTTHMSIVDADGNAVALTASVEGAFGSQRMASGFILNNQLTDFSLAPTLNGLPVANSVAPGRRPRSSMAPTIVTDRQGRLQMVIGSPGGSGIIAYVSRTIIGALEWGQSIQDAVGTGNVVAASSNVRLEADRLPAALPAALTARGWTIQSSQGEVSGLNGIRVTNGALQGGADPRREGVALRLTPINPAPMAHP